MAFATCELVWIKALLQDFGIPNSSPMWLYYENQATLHIAANHVFHKRTKHIDINCHVVREQLQFGVLSTAYVPSQFQLVDIFTKALRSDQFHILLSKLGIRDLHGPT